MAPITSPTISPKKQDVNLLISLEKNTPEHPIDYSQYKCCRK